METIELMQVLENFHKQQMQILTMLTTIVNRLDQIEKDNSKVYVDTNGNLTISKN